MVKQSIVVRKHVFVFLFTKKFKKIINLYARGDIDYDVALYAIKKTIRKIDYNI